MYDVCIFAGTTEGRRIAEAIAGTAVRAYVCAATDYGGALLPKAENLTVLAKRLAGPELEALLAKEKFPLVIDATHPYAALASRNIAAACEKNGLEYLRVKRGESEREGGAVYVDSIASAAEYLRGKEGNILAVTGSKELTPYTAIEGYEERLYVRVLPIEESVVACAEHGIPAGRILAMQGPFTREMNCAMLRMANAKYLVTKDSGASGGFEEKLEAARDTGAVCVIIGRPPESPGLMLSEALLELQRRWGAAVRPKVAVIGCGMGGKGQMTGEAAKLLSEADCLIGAKRIVEAEADGRPCFISMDSAKISAFIAAHLEYRSFAVLMSGDVGFYSGAKKLLPMLAKYDVQVCPGISSVQYLCAKLHTSWDDAHIISLHGRSGSAVGAVSENKKVFALVGGSGAAARVCGELAAAGLGDVTVSVGERLSYPDERITTGRARELQSGKFDPLSALLISNKSARPSGGTYSQPDEAFIRSSGGGPVVPMTKEEIRAVSLAKLRLEPDSVVYDIGAGTGSVSVELAKACPRGSVYAIEYRPNAVELIRQNVKKFKVFNLTAVDGKAPEACMPLPPPTHAFIGGTSGNMYEILKMLTDKNPDVRIVINLIALESIAAVIDCMERLGFDSSEMVQVSVAKSKKLGAYHLMNGQNPIMIVTCQKTADGKEKK